MTNPSHPGGIDLHEAFSRQVILVSGKGGVGKTTLSVFLAKCAASMGKNVLLCHMNRILNDTWEHDYIEEEDNITQIFITPKSCFREFMLLKLKSETLYNVLFKESAPLEVMQRAAPALSELLLLGKVYYEAKQAKLLLGHKWDHVIVDMPATGHAMTMLNITKVIKKIFTMGVVSRDTQKIEDLIHDRERTILLLASIPEYMAMQETADFFRKAEDTLHVQTGPVFINRVPPDMPDISSGEGEKVQELAGFFQDRSNAAKAVMEEFLGKIPSKVYHLPLIYGESSNPEYFDILEERVMECMEEYRDD